MTFAVRFCGEGEVTNTALERSLSIVGPQVANKCALISAGITAQVTLVW